MTSKIEFIEVNGKKFPIAMFSDEIVRMVEAYELTRDRYNIRNTEAAALGAYMNHLGVKVQEAAVEWLSAQLAPVSDTKDPE